MKNSAITTNSMKPSQTSEKKETFVNLTTSLYKHSGSVMKVVARKTTTSLCEKNELPSNFNILTNTFVIVSPTTML